MSQAITKTDVVEGGLARKGPQTIGDLLAAKMDSLKAVATRHLTAEKLVKLVLVACSRTPKLMQCHPMSVLQAAMSSAELGLAPGPLGQCYFIPFENRKNNTIECQFIIGYRGLIELARRSGNIVSIQAEVVRAGDEFEFAYGVTTTFRHVPKAADANAPVTHAWAIAHFVGGGHQLVVMTKAEVDRIRGMSKSGQFGPWKDHYAEMAKKTVVRRLCKMLPLTPETAADFGIAEARDTDGFSFKMPEAIEGMADDDLNASDALANAIEGGAEVVPEGGGSTLGADLQKSIDAEDASKKGEQGSLMGDDKPAVGTVDTKRKR